MSDWRHAYLRLTAHLRLARIENGLGQSAAAKRIGVSRRTFQRYEEGRTAPNALRLFKWASIVGVEMASQMTLSEG